MKQLQQEIIFFVIFALLTSSSIGVLTGYERQDITEDRRFGCIWKGGSGSGLICSCTENAKMYIQENSIASFQTASIQIQNCSNVIFGQNSIAAIRNLRNIHLRNIGSLEFEESSLKWYGYQYRDHFEERYDQAVPSLKIVIQNCTITQLSSYTFKGRINTIHFENVVFENMEPFAFDALLQTQRILILNSELKNLRLQPFKKFSTENFELNGVKATLIPSRFLSNITVYERFVITNCVFNTLRSGAFIVYNPASFQVSNTKIDHLDGEAFKVTTRGDVLFENNQFDVINDGAFRGIKVNKDEVVNKPVLVFNTNIFTSLTRDSLSINDDFEARFNNLNINETCDCKNIKHNIKDTEFYPNIKCLFNDEFITVKDYKTNWCSIIQSYSTTIIVVGVVVTIFIIIISVLVIYYKKVYLSRKYGSEKNSQKGNMSLIVPDGRTYKETELHVIVERADLLTTDL